MYVHVYVRVLELDLHSDWIQMAEKGTVIPTSNPNLT